MTCLDRCQDPININARHVKDKKFYFWKGQSISMHPPESGVQVLLNTALGRRPSVLQLLLLAAPG